MKKFVIGIMGGVVLATATVAYASSPTVQAILFPSTINIHKGGQINSLENNNAILNYDNSVYIPLRSIAETMGSGVHYTAPEVTPDSIPVIDIYTAPESWKLIPVSPPGNLPFSPLSLRLNHDSSSTNSSSIRIWAELYNTSGETLHITKSSLEIKIEKVTDSLELVWSAAIAPPSETPPGEWIPGKDPKVIWGVKSPSVYWDKKDKNGNPVSPGQYRVTINQAATIEYDVGYPHQGRTESQVIESDTSNITMIYVQ